MFKVILNKVSVFNEGTDRLILKDVVFEAEPGNIYTILGKNGTGKSTLLKALTGLLDKRFYSVEGSIIYNGKDILKSDTDIQSIRKNEIKYVFQDAVNSFDHLKTFNYYFTKLNSYPEKDINHLLDFFLLPDSKSLFKMYPYEVSGGMAQRISLILALLSHPKIILLDEPTSGIDAPIANLMIIKLKEFVSKDNLVFMVTHDVELTKSISSKVAMLSENTLSDFHSPKEFFYLNQIEANI